MSALAVPLLRLAAQAVYAGLRSLASSAATSAAGGIATGAILSLPGDTSQDKEKAQTDTQVKTRARTRDCKCPPEKGLMAPVNHSMSELSAQYQQYVTGFPRGMEWKFCDIDFDGFQSTQCLLQEAKANYDFFFDKKGNPNFFFFHAKSKNNPDKVTDTSAYESTMKQVNAQHRVVVKNEPARLCWYFMQKKFYAWATTTFAAEGLVATTEFKPMNVAGDTE
ncbi:Tox-REase-5 domain-containing protein [Caballeronia sp. AZ10_KS36]|uniref:Tox-REase-5 domain-containing protein n=1 Tax=Caballeronia sp. AZ10_KS36 TaxID=2921757 RepID=UPI002027E3A5|nr:Tox-REase-5 domain-containing protein [Caballeronia sp. AZ10_KS36]